MENTKSYNCIYLYNLLIFKLNCDINMYDTNMAKIRKLYFY